MYQKRINEVWDQTVAGVPFTSRVSTLTCMGITLACVCEGLYSTIASWAHEPVPPFWVDLTCSGLALCSLAILTYRSFQEKKVIEDPYKKIDEYLKWLKQNPLFLEIWEEINQEEKLTFNVISKEKAEKKENYSADAWLFTPQT